MSLTLSPISLPVIKLVGLCSKNLLNTIIHMVIISYLPTTSGYISIIVPIMKYASIKPPIQYNLLTSPDHCKPKLE